MKSKKMLHEEMSWNEFLERYLINHEEFVLKIKEYKINLCYGMSGTFSYNVILNSKKTDEKNFNTPTELIENFKFFGKTLENLWNEFE